MVDMHCHVVWGVDDGARSREAMQQMLRQAAENHVRDLVCTSHISPGEAAFPQERYDLHLADGQAFCDAEGLNLKLHPGSEILYTDAAPRMLHEGRIPRLNGRHAVLVEFWYEAPFSKMTEAARLLGNEGVTVIFAHIERYRVLRDVRLVEELRGEWDVVTQMNASTVIKRQPFLAERWKRKVLSRALVDLVASDAHNTDSRSCNMLAAREALAGELGEPAAERMCGGLARELLAL